MSPERRRRARRALKHWRLTILLVAGVAVLAVGLKLAVDEAVDAAVPAAVESANVTVRAEFARRDAATRRASYDGCVANVVFKQVVAAHVSHTADARGGTGVPRDERIAQLYRRDRNRILATRPPLPPRHGDTPEARCAARWLLTSNPPPSP